MPAKKAKVTVKTEVETTVMHTIYSKDEYGEDAEYTVQGKNTEKRVEIVENTTSRPTNLLYLNKSTWLALRKAIDSCFDGQEK